MDAKQVERINALARKQKAEGLTEEEKREQKALREQYLREWRENLKATLDRVYIQQEDGSYAKLQRKFMPRNTQEEPKN